jgi:hypothetical protein
MSLRELTDKYLPSAMNLYIAVDMGTWVPGGWCMTSLDRWLICM